MGSKLKNWKMKPMVLARKAVRCPRDKVPRSAPLTSTFPESNTSMPPRMLSRVDLPLPETPRRAM